VPRRNFTFPGPQAAGKLYGFAPVRSGVLEKILRRRLYADVKLGP
jgi:hypothetical protein